jgi:hypothetical protein
MHAQWNAPQAALQHNFTELDQVPRDTLNYIFLAYRSTGV